MIMKIGNTIRDNDPRMTGRKLEITAMCDGYVFAKRIDYTGKGRGREFRIIASRIFTDAKIRKTGFSLENVKSPSTGATE